MLTKELQTLLQETMGLYVDPVAQIEQVVESSIEAGLSGAAVKRYELTLAGVAAEHSTLSLVTKNASLKERRTLTFLGAQHQPNVSFNHTLDLQSDMPALICMQDVGSIQRPNSLEYISQSAIDREAAAIAAIHAANRGSTVLDWLPRADRAYYNQKIETEVWRPHWERAVADQRFCDLFRADIPRVEAASTSIVDEMAALYAEGDTLTVKG